jgi:hypothetical protein
MQRLPTLLASIAFLTSSLAMADADIPKEWAISYSQLSGELVNRFQSLCGEDGFEVLKPEDWNAFKVKLDKNNTLFLVQCALAASNDFHFALVKTKSGDIKSFNFGGDRPVVYNVRFSRDRKTMIDISQAGAGCVNERRWRWARKAFRLLRAKTIGC